MEIENNFDTYWYFENANTGCKVFDKNELKHSYSLHVVKLGSYFWDKGLVSLLRKDYDNFLITGATRNLSLYTMLLAKCIFFRKKKIYLWSHGYYGKESWIQKKIINHLLFSMADGNFIYGNYGRNLMVEDGIIENKLWTIYNTLDYDRQLEIRNNIKPSDVYQQHFDNDNSVLIFLGRLTPVKKLEQAIEALGKLRDQGKLFNMVFVGDGGEREKLESLVKTLSLTEKVWFFGACYDEAQNAELVYNADLCVAPGNIGLTAMHVLMFGCPALTHGDFKWQMPEFESIQEGKTGSFFERGNVNSLASKINEWFSAASYDRNSIREACYKEIDEKWNLHVQLRILKEHIK
jgi:glycosyltransferase involved in cell wall biosynthesis